MTKLAGPLFLLMAAAASAETPSLELIPAPFPPAGSAGMALCPGEDPCADGECATYDLAAGCWVCDTCALAAGVMSFKTWDAPAGTDPEADSATDTMLLEAGAGVSITGDAVLDKLTFANTGALTSFVTWNAPAGTDPVASLASDTMNLAVAGPIALTGDAATKTLTWDCPTCALDSEVFWSEGLNGIYANVNDGYHVAGGADIAETMANAGYTDVGGDLFASGSIAAKVNFYTDGAFIAGATTSYGDNLITPSTTLVVTRAVQSGQGGQDGAFIIYSEQGVTDYSVTFQPHAAMTQAVTYTMPPDDGGASQFLQSDGAGNLTWATPSGGDATTLDGLDSTDFLRRTADDTFTPTTWDVNANTIDGADNKAVTFSGGGGTGASQTRGAYLTLPGNEFAGTGGAFSLVSGETSGAFESVIDAYGNAAGEYGHLHLRSLNNTSVLGAEIELDYDDSPFGVRLRMEDGANDTIFDIGTAGAKLHTADNAAALLELGTGVTLRVGGNAIDFPDDMTIANSTDDTGSLILYGGAVGGSTTGARIELYGDDSAGLASDVWIWAGSGTNAGDVQIEADGVGAVFGVTIESTGVLSATVNGLIIGASGTPIADSYAASATIDFASTTATTVDSSAITVTGAALGDTCTVGTDAAATWVTGADFSCYVSAAGQVKVRFSAHGANIDPGSDTFRVRVFDP